MTSNNKQNKVYDFFYGLSKITYIIGGPNYWPENLKLPNWFHKIHKLVSIITHTTVIVLVISMWGALYTQTVLSEKQKNDILTQSLAHSIHCCNLLNAEYYAETIKEVIKNLAIDSKIFNDKETERVAVKRMKYFSGFVLGLFCISLILFCIEGILPVIKYDGTFTAIICAWPDINDHSKIASVVRIVEFMVWCFVVLRITTASYCLIIPITISLSLQFMNLKSYFYSLNDIFKGNEDQIEKEKLYEQGFKNGILWHADILRCTKLAQKTLSVVFGGQVLLSVTALGILLLQFVNMERSFGNISTIITTIAAVLFSTGCLVWNAGDIPVEAFALSTAMFESGWHNCRTDASAKVRSMITIAMWQSQKPVQLQCFGLVQMSYNSYLTIVKSSYSLFSVLY